MFTSHHFLAPRQIPIIADTKKEISAQYGVLIEHLGIANRGLFIINPEVWGRCGECVTAWGGL